MRSLQLCFFLSLISPIGANWNDGWQYQDACAVFSVCSKVDFDPEENIRVHQGVTKNLTVRVNCSADLIPAGSCLDIQLENPIIAILNSNQQCMGTENSTIVESASLEGGSLFRRVQVTGRGIGRSRVVVTITAANGSSWVLCSDFEIHALRTQIWQTTVARIVIAVGIGLNTMAFGCKLRIETIKQYLRRPVGVVISIACQYLLLPTIAYVIGLILKLSPNMALALLTTGCCPGGGPSNMCSALVKGDVNLSIILTLFSTILALGATPAWLYSVGNVILRDGYPGHSINVPWIFLFIAVLWFSVPCIIGIIIRRYSHRAGRLLFRIIRPAALLLLLAFFAFSLYYTHPVFLFADRWEIVVACFLLPTVSFLLSFSASLLLRQSIKISLTIMIETGIQNVAVAIVLVSAIIPQPDGDVAGVVPIIVLFVTFVPILAIFVGITIYSCVKSHQSERKEDYSISTISISDSSDTTDGPNIKKNSVPGLNSDIVTNGELGKSVKF